MQSLSSWSAPNCIKSLPLCSLFDSIVILPPTEGKSNPFMSSTTFKQDYKELERAEYVEAAVEPYSSQGLAASAFDVRSFSKHIVLAHPS